jgi:hypothetical protein
MQTSRFCIQDHDDQNDLIPNFTSQEEALDAVIFAVWLNLIRERIEPTSDVQRKMAI